MQAGYPAPGVRAPPEPRWAINEKSKKRKRAGRADTSAKDAQALYDKLQNVVLPMFYHNRPQYLRIMLFALALNGSFFNTQRMLQEYLLKAYME